MRQLKYINSKNDVIDFRDCNTQIYRGNFHAYEWSYEGTERQFGSTVDRFTKKPINYEMIIAVKGDVKACEKALNHIAEIIEYDIVNNAQGKLYWGDYYLSCNIISSNVMPSENFFGAEKTMNVFAPYPFWIREISKRFYPVGQGSSEEKVFLDYPYNYPYDYTAPEGGNEKWHVEHYAESEFKMTIFGPCIKPRVLINGYPYEIYDTLESTVYKGLHRVGI